MARSLLFEPVMTKWALGLVLVAGLWGCGRVETENGDDDTAGVVGIDGNAPGVGGATGAGDPSSTTPFFACGASNYSVPIAGTAGTTETAGTAGTIGMAGTTGTAGAAGAPADVTFAPMCEVSNDFRSECTFEETCRALGCGDGISRFDEQGCQRECQSSADCGADERCRFTTLALEITCGAPSEIEGCFLEDGQCFCAATDDCGLANVCVKTAEYPADLDCDVSVVTCAKKDELLNGRLALDGAAPAESERELTISTCRDKVLARLDELGCP